MIAKLRSGESHGQQSSNGQWHGRTVGKGPADRRGHDIDQNIVAIHRAGEHAVQGAHQAEEVSRQLSQQVVELKQLIGAFRV